MGKGHRDNHRARKKRGPEAFAKKAERRLAQSRCNICRIARPANKLEGGLCKNCLKRESTKNRQAPVA